MRYSLKEIPNLILAIQGVNGFCDGGMADRISRSKKTVSNWRNGATVPSAEDIIELCEVFDLEITDFFREEETNND